MNGPVLQVIPWFVLIAGMPGAVAQEVEPPAPVVANGTAAAAPAPARIPLVGEFTRAQRLARGPIDLQPTADMIALPVPGLAEPFHAPFRWPVDPATFPYRWADNPEAILAQLPVTPALEQYLAKRRALKPAQWQSLVDWCLQENLPVCAEYELRCKLATFKHFYDPGYKPIKDQWLKLAETHRSAYIFPLPVSGEWFVVPDTSGHHRMKAGAAFACDLTILKNGKMHAGAGTRLEDYYCWRQPILAQADAIVVQADDHFADLPLAHGASLAEFDQANSVVLDFGGGIRGAYVHLHQGSLTVKVGDAVHAGQKLAEVGNSGAAGAPHLHFTLLDNGHLSLRGRFAYERLAGDSWVDCAGDDLKEGAQIRNRPQPWGETPPPAGAAQGTAPVVEPVTAVTPAVSVEKKAAAPR